MRVLEYADLDSTRVSAAYQKVKAALERDDFRSIDAKKLASSPHGKFYRARLDQSNRLLFTVVRHRDQACALILEVIAHHAYEKSRFLRGARIDEDRIPAVEAPVAAGEATVVPYLHPRRSEVHLLDKVLSFDDAQEAVYRLAPPAIVVGGAGSGKTALTLEKLKHAQGEVLYVTLSAYLARSARDLYYAHGFEREGQEVSFLAYRDFVETIRIPPGREATWQDFAGWFGRMRAAFKGLDAHQAFEEIRGVITADPEGVLGREPYRELGVRQSIFRPEERDAVYDLFLKYREWLAEAGLYDLNMVAHEWRHHAEPRYDFAVVDEVQDLTAVQLALVLAQLGKPGQFLLAGDSNQIVHPNFFSWSKVKSLFWRNPALAERQTLHILRTNFRNGVEATRVANTLLKIKQQRFGSIDRESNFLVTAAISEPGATTLLADEPAVKRELDEKTRGSTRFAILVLRDEDKAEAARHFRTPLIFSVQEAKGLEYENIVLYRFVSGHRQEYREIVAGVTPADLAVESLEYRRGADKADKSLEVYKFYVNALYVALTRATRNIYLIESDTGHPLLGLLGLAPGKDRTPVEVRTSSREDWQAEARKLELHGKLEQAAAIRKDILRQTPVPWPIFDRIKVREALTKVFQDQVPTPKFRHQLFDYAACYGLTSLAGYLWHCTGYSLAKDCRGQFPLMRRKYFGRYEVGLPKEILKECDRHGVDHRTPMNLTPLITAVAVGNVALAEALLERGADIEACDSFGCNALHWAMAHSFADAAYARTVFAGLYDRLAPAAVDVKVGDRLVRLDRHLSEYFLFQTLWALFRGRFSTVRPGDLAAFNTEGILGAYANVPQAVLREQRRQRAFVSAVLARNELRRDYAYNRRLFVRLRQGWYQFNPYLSVRVRRPDGEAWTPILTALDLPGIKEICEPRHWRTIDALLVKDQYAPTGVPMAGKLFLEAQAGGPPLAAGRSRP